MEIMEEQKQKQDYIKAQIVYDLEGNVTEWTLEANGSLSRSVRGGEYFLVNDRGCARLAGSSVLVAVTGGYPGTRTTLYIK